MQSEDTSHAVPGSDTCMAPMAIESAECSGCMLILLGIANGLSHATHMAPTSQALYPLGSYALHIDCKLTDNIADNSDVKVAA